MILEISLGNIILENGGGDIPPAGILIIGLVVIVFVLMIGTQSGGSSSSSNSSNSNQKVKTAFEDGAEPVSKWSNLNGYEKLSSKQQNRVDQLCDVFHEKHGLKYIIEDSVVVFYREKTRFAKIELNDTHINPLYFDGSGNIRSLLEHADINEISSDTSEDLFRKLKNEIDNKLLGKHTA